MATVPEDLAKNMSPARAGVGAATTDRAAAVVATASDRDRERRDTVTFFLEGTHGAVPWDWNGPCPIGPVRMVGLPAGVHPLQDQGADLLALHEAGGDRVRVVDPAVEP